MDSDQRYKQLIDTYVERTESVTAQSIRQGRELKAVDLAQFNTFIASLSADGKECLAKLLDEERLSAFHDALFILVENDVHLHDEIGELVYEYSEDLHCDYVYRLDGNPWYDEC